MKKLGGTLALTLLPVTLAAEPLDILLLFNESARAQINDTDTWAVQAVEFYNQALVNANVPLEGRLVFAGDAPASFNKVLTGNTELNEMIGDSYIADLKQQYGADAVGLITGEASSYCGYGKIIQGDGSTGLILAGQAERAVFWSKKSCGYKTFSHEMGHIMGLGHSYKQGSKGGMYDWARGHGAQNQWVTLMAYTGAYNAPSGNRLQVFSNPAVNYCQGAACGKNQQSLDGADAASYIKYVADQLVAFTPGVDDNPNLPPTPCSQWSVPNNLITNGDMESTQDWVPYPSSQSLSFSIIDQQETQCSESRLLTSQRSNESAGIGQSFGNILQIDKKYRLNATAKLFLPGRETLYAHLKDDAGHSQLLGSASITNSEMTTLSAEFIPDNSFGAVSLSLVFSMSSTDDFILDQVSVAFLEEVTVEPPPSSEFPEWDSKTVYDTPGYKVYYEGVIYQNKWWTQGDTPGSQPYGPWEVVD